MTKNHVVYKMYDDTDTLVYVGVSKTMFARMVGHASNSSFFKTIVRIDLEHFETRDESLTRELFLIKSMRPQHNKQHNPNNAVKYSRVHKGDYDSRTMLNATETAKVLGINRRTLRLWLRDGKCPVAPIPDMSPSKWRRVDVEAWVRGETP